MKIRHILLVVALVFLTAGSETARESSQARPAGGGLSTYGAFRAMFHEGETGEMVKLETLLPDPKLYAVGALSGLRGEVTVVAGQVYLSYPEGETGVRSEAPDHTEEGATLLVTAGVEAWMPVTLERELSFADLDLVIGNLAASAGLPADLPFPFLIQGEVRDLAWHVVDGEKLDGTAESCEDHRRESVSGTVASTDALLIGFHSTKHHGVFTHMGSDTHIHCIIEEPFVAGHVDHVVLPAGTVVGFPVR